MIDAELLEQLRLMAGCMLRMDKRLSAKIQDEAEAAEMLSNLELERELLDKMRELFNDYMNAIKRQTMLEAANEELNKKLGEMEARLTGLEAQIPIL